MANNSKFWFGLVVGALGGVLISQSISRKRRMPNAQAWQKILSKDMDHITAAAFMAQVQQRYDELIARKITLESKALQSHLQENILPGLALYQTWLAQGLDQKAALEKVDAVYAAQYQEGSTKLARQSSVLKFLPGGFSTFKRLVQFLMQQGFPAPGFEVEYIPDDPQRFGFDIHRCFYLDMLTHFGAPELTPSFCKIDDFTMAALSQEIHWERSGTLGMGATHCDFRWAYVPLEAVE